MWPFNRNAEVLISSSSGEPYFGSLICFLETHFGARFLGKKIVELDLSFFEYSIGEKTITVVSEGMVGTSLLGEKRLVRAVIEKAKEVEPQLIDQIS